MRVKISAMVAGFCLITIGFYAAWHPLGAIASGLMLILAALKGRKE